MDRLSEGLERNRAYGLTLVRIVMGLMMFHAGYSKVFIKKLPAVIQSFEINLGVFLPEITAPFISFLELIGGAALVLGIWTRYLGLVFAVEFVVAAYVLTALPTKTLFSPQLEYLLVAVGLLLATNGGGAFNLGNLLKRGN